MQRTTWLLAFALASTACAGLWVLSAQSDRRAVMQAARLQLATTARLLDQHADRALEAGDRAVRSAVQAVGDPRTLRESGRDSRLHEELRAITDGSPQLGSAWVMDAEGVTVAENWGFPPRLLGSFAHRPYFRAHEAGERGLHVGPLAVGPNMGRLRFTLSRALLAPDGSFAGVAATGVFSDYFAEVYAGAGLGRGARFALVRTDGAPLAIWPPPADGAVIAPDIPLPLPGAGEALVRETADGTLLALRRLERFPVALMVSQPRDEVLGEWRDRTWRSGGVISAIILVLAGLTIIGLRGAARRRALTAALRAERASLERRVAERTAALAESEARFREMADNAPVMVWVSDASGACTFLGRSWFAFTGQTRGQGLGRGWLDAVHPEDRERVSQAIHTAHADRDAFRAEYRLCGRDGDWRWVLDVAVPRLGPDGVFLGHVGSVIDITDRREAEERRALMARELDHRAKNALSVVQAALRLTPKEDAAAYAQAVEGRVAALARAHSVLAEGSWRGASLRAVVEAELATFLATTQGAAAPRAVLEGPAVMLTPAAVQALSMTLHELATNATKYGALSRPAGRVRVSWALDPGMGLLRLRWEERGGPAITAPPSRRGFGSRVIEATMASQLGGRTERRWEAEGLVCTIDLPVARVLAAGSLAAMPGAPPAAARRPGEQVVEAAQ